MKQPRPFYVGYRARADASVARFIGVRIAGVVVIALLSALLITLAQQRFANASFEYGTLRVFDGILREFPHPTVLVARPGQAGVPYSRYLLVAPGKHGFAQHAAGLDGRRVVFHGTLIHRDNRTMIEVVPASLQVHAVQELATDLDLLGPIRLRGEIVDSKCYLGVMKPGEATTHRACAIRCLSGGIPALFVVRSRDGTVDHLLLSDPDGRALNKDILHLVAQPVEIEGQLVRMGADLILRADAKAITPLR